MARSSLFSKTRLRRNKVSGQLPRARTMITEEVVQGARQYLMNTYTRYPIALSRAQGMRVWDVEGREYLDFLAGAVGKDPR